MCLDLLTILVTREGSLLPLSVDPRGFLLRLMVAGLLLWVVYQIRLYRDTYVLVLFAMLLPALLQFHFAGGRINGDGTFYYVYLRSIWKDGDVHLENEYRHYGLANRSDLSVPTVTGYRRSIFSVGPAVIWSPFFGVGEVYARQTAWSGGVSDTTGYGPTYRNAVALGSLLYGFVAVLLTQAMLRRYFSHTAAFAGAVLMWVATNLHWYMVQQPIMSHASSTFVATLFLWLWFRNRSRIELKDAILLGLVGGLAMCIRWQNGVLFLLPGMDLVVHLYRKNKKALFYGGVFTAGVFLGFLPQMLTWKAMFGVFLLPDPPHGVDFMRFDHPYILEMLFSSRHGLLSWTPIVWLGYLGLVPLAKQRSLPIAGIIACLLIMTYVNMCAGDWWAGGSYSNRRFDSALPILAFGLASSFELLRSVVARYPSMSLGTVLSGFVLWNFLFMEQYRRFMIPRDDTVSFTQVVENNAQILFESVGAPFSWPANWIFAWRFGVSPDKYDLVVGRYLFYRQNNLGGVVELGDDDGALIGSGWGGTERREGVALRRTRSSSARLFVPIDEPKEMLVTWRLSSRPGPVATAVSVNGVGVGNWLVEPGFSDYTLLVPAKYWRREINTIDLELVEGDEENYLLADKVVFKKILN